MKKKALIILIIPAVTILLAGCNEAGSTVIDETSEDWITGQVKLVDERSNFGSELESYGYCEDGGAGIDENPTELLWVDGHEGQGVDFNNGHARMMIRFINPTAGNPGDFSIFNTVGALTLNIWMYWRGAGLSTVGGLPNDNDGGQWIWSMSGQNGFLKVALNDEYDGLLCAAGYYNTDKTLAPGVLVPKEKWVMITFSMDGSTIKLYLDGMKLGEESVSFTPAKMGMDIFRIGGGFSGPPSFNAIVDQASYWPRTLTDAAIAKMYDDTM
jgi:hypothetical protein